MIRSLILRPRRLSGLRWRMTPDSGVLVMSQHGGCAPGNEDATVFMMSLAAVAARAVLSAAGYNVQKALEMLDTWTSEYAEESS